jgi:hypothetical protein
MKLIICLFLLSLPAYAVTPLDMKTGYWEYQTSLTANPMLKAAMASISKLPKAQRDQIMKKMGGSGGVQKFKKCFTAEDMKNWESKMNEGQEKNGCKMIVNKSTKSVYEAVRKCKNGEGNMKISFKMDSNKSGTSSVTMPMSPNPIESKLKWLSSTCPKEKKK